jgi:single-strand DNA-binding protein
MNVVVLQGVVASPLVVRELAGGDVAVSFDITTRHQGSSCTVPASWISPATIPTWSVGDELTVVGTVRRRFFRAGGGTQSRTEVLVGDVASTSKRAAVRKLIDQATRQLGP